MSLSWSTQPPSARSRPSAEADAEERSSWKGSHFLSISLGDPGPFFPFFADLFGPIRHVVWLSLPLTWIGVHLLVTHSVAFWEDLARLTVTISYWTNMLIGLFFTSMLAKFWEGVVMAYYGVPPEDVGFRLLWGIWPQFYVARRPVASLDFPQQRNCYLGPALQRLMLFSFGIIIWAMFRRSGSGIASFALVISNAGLLSFLHSANPIWFADGYRILAAQLREPKLREHGQWLLVSLITFRKLPKELGAKEFWGLLIWASLAAVFTLTVVFFAISILSTTLIADYAGFGAFVFLCLVVVMVFYFRHEGPLPASMKRNAKRRAKYRAAMQADPSLKVAVPTSPAQDRVDRSGNVVGMASRDEVDAMGGEALQGEGADKDDATSGSDIGAGAGGPAPGLPPEPEQDPARKKTGQPAAAASASSLDDILAMPAPPSAKDNPADVETEVDSVLESVFGDSSILSPSDQDGLGLQDDDDDRLGDMDLADLWTDDSADPLSDDGPTEPPRANAARAEAAAAGGAAAAGFQRTVRRRPANDPLADLDHVLRMGDSAPTPWSKWRKRLIWAVVLAIMAYVAFLPYPYDVGGNFTVAPLTKSEARARIDGEIVSVNVKEGDWVKEGDILAVLSDWNQARDLAINQADDAKFRADLQTMLNGATPEEIGVAKQEVATAEVAVRTAKQTLDRQEALFKSGTISQKVVEDARDAFDAAVAARDAAQARLNLVSAPARETEVAAQKATIDRNTADLTFAQSMLDYTRIRATTDGQVVSDLTKLPVGAHLAVGGLFTLIEDNRTVIATVDVPETSIDDVTVGAEVELRLWSDPLNSVFGKVKSIAPRAEERDYGWVIRVDVEVPNEDGHLQANMTGFGKIRAADRPVWQAFSQTIIGFLKIELWSWVP